MEEITRLVICGDSNAVSNLISKNPNIVREYIRDNYGLTLLDWSIFNGQHKIARILLENGAEIEAKDRNGNTALLIAARLGKLDIVKLLLEKKSKYKSEQ
ncbi:MAG: ankyrin repeat domain-containing protein [Rickettsiales bacterium]